MFSWDNFRTTAMGRFITRNTVWLPEKTWIAAQGTSATLGVLDKAGQGCVRSGESGISTSYFSSFACE